ncbi:MAG: endonuclease III [Pirellulales bacterium]|nr:endonuclease III [Pirellulales bacterium]
MPQPTLLADSRRHAAKIVRRLNREYPDPKCSLTHRDPLQLLVATILSAQCTDERVNMVTPALFKKYPDAEAFATARIKSLEKLIKSTGFYRNKAKNIKACCQTLVKDHNGQVPRDLDALVALDGVGRKTAHVVLGNAYGIASGVVVDTHVTRISRRLGMTDQKDAVKIEFDLEKQLPKKEWINFTHRIINHGRKVCKARKPNCDACVLNDVCPRVGVST